MVINTAPLITARLFDLSIAAPLRVHYFTTIRVHQPSSARPGIRLGAPNPYMRTNTVIHERRLSSLLAFTIVKLRGTATLGRCPLPHCEVFVQGVETWK